MPESLVQFLCVFFGFAVGTIYAGKAMRRCIELKLYNDINERSSHTIPTPRGGGYAFVMVTSIFSLIWLHIGTASTHQTFLVTLTLCSLFIAYLGWLDDKHTISAKLRLICHILAAALCTITLPSLLEDILPLWAEKTLIILAWVWFINLYNFMDGIDGLAAIQAAFIAYILSVMMPEIAPILLVLMGSVLGILRFNWAPARVFMGDVGSTYLGFILAGFMFYSLTLNFEGGFWSSIIISILFTLDATFTLIKRILKGKAPWQAHKEHFYQRAVLIGMSHSQVVKRVILMNLLFSICAIAAFLSPDIGLYIFIFVCIVCIAVALRIRYLEGGLVKK
jgi:UDP-N-acetylmuramyl pentapeptide phosphotransferase/UDP-N-acetylglucosamine-1-phosphate transferase